MIQRHDVADTLRQTLEERGEVIVPPSGTSMGPVFARAEGLVIRPVSSADLPLGSVIAARRGDQWIVHRIVWKRHTPHGATYRTKGDAARRLDWPAVAQTDIVGKVVALKFDGEIRSLETISARATAMALGLKGLAVGILAAAATRLFSTK